MNQKLQVGVAGCGYWGPNLIRNLSELPECDLALVCDIDPRRIEHVNRLHPGVPTDCNFDTMLNGINLDAIFVATPAHRHFELASQSLMAGKHTFIEKPMATSSDHCRELVGIADTGELTLMVGHTFLYSDPVRKIKEIVDSGDIGELRYISSRRLNLGLFQKEINVVWDLAPHDVSIIAYLMGESPCSVNCQGHSHVVPNVEDVSYMSLHFPSGRFATVHNSWLEPRKVREMTIVGSKRMIIYDDLEPLQKIRIYDVRVDTPPHYDTFAEFHWSYHYGDMYAPHIAQSESLRNECEHFLEAIRHKRRPLTGGGEGLQLVKVLEAADASLRKHGASVDIEDEDVVLERLAARASGGPMGGLAEGADVCLAAEV
jgi:predicted dehydrogenase